MYVLNDNILMDFPGIFCPLYLGHLQFVRLQSICTSL